jgi:hypothetical protein
MASGCIVVGQISGETRRVVRERGGRELPVVEADPDTLEDVLRGLASGAELEHLRAEGLDFVRAVHGGGPSGAALLEHFVGR